MFNIYSFRINKHNNLLLRTGTAKRDIQPLKYGKADMITGMGGKAH
jgi:hypothetical protein